MVQDMLYGTGDMLYMVQVTCYMVLPCVDFMDVIMGDIPYITTLCLNGTLPCVDFMDVSMGDNIQKIL